MTGKLVLLVLEPVLLLEPSLVCLIRNARLAWNRNTPLDCWASIDSLPPLVQVGKLLEVDTSKVRDVDPAEVGNVCSRVFVSDEVLAALEANVEDSVQTFSLADVSLRRVWNALLGQAVETTRRSQYYCK